MPARRAARAERAHERRLDQVLGIGAIAREHIRVSEEGGAALADQLIQCARPGAHGAILAWFMQVVRRTDDRVGS